MLRATIKSLFARKLRLVLTALAVVLGVGMTAGSFILTDTALKSFDDLFGDVYRGTDVVVQAQTAFDPSGQNNTGGGTERKPIPRACCPTCRPWTALPWRTARSAARRGSWIRPRTR